MHVVKSSEMQAADAAMMEQQAYPGVLLMETAGRLAAEHILQDYPHMEAAFIACGPGNNGGDGMVIARYLRQAGWAVYLLLSQPLAAYTADAGTNAKLIQHGDYDVFIGKEASAEAFRTASGRSTLLIDALLGTGVSGTLREPIASMVQMLRDSYLPIVAIDLPTGLSADTGRLFSPPPEAERTYTFQQPKYCHYIWPAAGYCGHVTVLDIGIYPRVLNAISPPAFCTSPAYIAGLLHTRHANAHKGTYGHVLLAGGSQGMGGSITLAAMASLKSGAGLATACIPTGISAGLMANAPEVMLLPQGPPARPTLDEAAAESFLQAAAGKAALVLGPGLDTNADARLFLQSVLQGLRAQQPRLPMLLDADALNLLAAQPELKDLLPATCLLSPHPGEAARLAKAAGLPYHTPTAVQADRLAAAQALANAYQATVVLKGAGTLIAAPDGRLVINTTGNDGLATAGSGDVLAGLIGGLLAQGYPPLEAAALGTWWHGAAADAWAAHHRPASLTASSLLQQLALVQWPG